MWVWTVSLPLTVVNASDGGGSLTPADVIGWIMWVFGFLIEAAADQQKLSFKNSPENRGKWCDVGVWKYSRHPNYFGEVSISIYNDFLIFGIICGARKPVHCCIFVALYVIRCYCGGGSLWLHLPCLKVQSILLF